MSEKEKLETILKQYKVNKDGTIINIKRNKEACYMIDKDGYKRLRFWVKRKEYRIFVHRLVALVYLNNPNNYPVVNHKDGNKTNNSVNNLEWCTVKYNTQHAEVNNLKKHHTIKVAQIDINTNKTLKIFNSITEASKAIGISRQDIGIVSRGIRKTAGGYKWKRFND